MKCILLSGGLFQIYSNINENILSYEDLTNKLYLKYPKAKKDIEKYTNIKTLDKRPINDINSELINILNKNYDNKIGNLFEGQKENFETIVLNQLDSFLHKFQKVYFNYENLLYLLLDYNIFKLLDIDISQISFYLNIKEIFNDKENIPQKYLVFDNKLETLYFYHSLGCFTVYLSHLVKIDLKTFFFRCFCGAIVSG